VVYGLTDEEAEIIWGQFREIIKDKIWGQVREIIKDKINNG
jgi:hypothetical protein